ncbi:MAG: hypothetical protein E6767_19555 [Dysgonomonas sp.]|nr:hypothetical protein [Dysgonomonas sp.]
MAIITSNGFNGRIVLSNSTTPEKKIVAYCTYKEKVEVIGYSGEYVKVKKESGEKGFLDKTETLHFCNQEKIDGLGKLKIGMSVTELQALFDEDILLERSQFVKYGHKLENVDAVRGFILKEYTPTGDYKLENIDLIFYSDSLYSIYTINNTYTLREIFSLRYGDPFVEKATNTKQFTNGFGNKITKQESEELFTWETNIEDISCTAVLSIRYSGNGQEVRKYFFNIKNDNTENRVKSIEAENKKRKEDTDKKEKLETLKDL